MGTNELKSDLRKMLDTIENEELLRTVYDFLMQGQTVDGGQIWSALTEEQKKEVYFSYDESEDDDNLIKWDEIKKKF